MEKEEAIEILKGIYPKGKYETDLSKALDMAIKALENKSK